MLSVMLCFFTLDNPVYQTYDKGKFPAEALRQARSQTLANLRELTKSRKEPLTPVKLWESFIEQRTRE
jgi:hypothetical protein